MAVLAIVAIILAGRRKPARATRRLPRNPRWMVPALPIEEAPTKPYRRAGLIRRVFASGGLGVVAVVSGALAAIFIAALAAFAVTTLTGMLR
jgi:hypothetical protein